MADSLNREQDKKYKELREEGKDKQEAAEEAAPPNTTEARAESAEAEEQ